MRDIVSEGQVVFDRADSGHDDTLIVTVPDAGTVHEQDPRTREAIRDADDNDRFDTTDGAQCTEVVYLDSDMSDTAYTFPTDRLYAPEATKHTLGYSPVVWAKADMLANLYEQLPLSDIRAMDADVEGKVLLAARDLLSMRGVDHEEFSEDYDRELHDCPECDTDLMLEDPIESAGDGVAYGYLACSNTECDWKGREEWVLTQTVDTREEGVKVGEPTKAYFGETDDSETES